LLPGQFAMPSELPSIDSGDAPWELAARVASGSGFWTEWLAELSREGLLEALLTEDVIARALAGARTSHKYDRVLTARMTMICVVVACLFPAGGYDAVLARASGLPGLRFKPGTEIPAGSAFSQARKLLGEHAMRRLFELDAEHGDAEPGITALWKGLEATALDGTTMELARNDELSCEFGSSSEGGRPLLRIAAHVRTATRRWIGAKIGSYHDGKNNLADRLEWSFRPGMLNLADRGFFSMDRFVRFAATGADLAWEAATMTTVPEANQGLTRLRVRGPGGVGRRRRAADGSSVRCSAGCGSRSRGGCRLRTDRTPVTSREQAEALVPGHGVIGAELFDKGGSRTVAWDRRPQTAAKATDTASTLVETLPRSNSEISTLVAARVFGC
jgi:hypothetical protein